MKKINAGNLHEHAVDEERFNALLVENPGIVIEDDIYFARNIHKLVQAAISSEHHDFLHWINDQEHLSDATRLNLVQILLSASVSLKNAEQAHALQSDLIERYGTLIREASNYHLITWGLLRDCIIGEGEDDALASLRDTLTTYYKNRLPNNGEPLLTVICESATGNNTSLAAADLELILTMVDPDNRDTLLPKIYQLFVSKNQLDHAKEIVRLGVDPFANENELAVMIKDPTQEQRQTVNALENYKVNLMDPDKNAALEKGDAENSFIV